MANNNRKYVGLQVKLEGKDTVKKELQDIFKYVNENKNIKLNIDTSSLNGFKESLTKIESEIGKLAGAKIINTDNLKNDVNNIDNVTNKINNLQNTSGKITSTSIKFVDNKAVQDITNLNQGLGKTEKIITDLNTKSQTIIKTDNLQKAEKETQKVADSYDKLLYKINQFKDKGIFNNSIYNNKTNGLDSMMKNVDFTNLEKAFTQIKTISSRLDDLSSKSNKINYIQKALDSFKNSYDNLRKGENKEIFATLNVSDINSYKKSLDELTKMRNNLMNGAGNNATFKNIDDTINNLKTNLTTLQSQFSSNLGIDKMITKARNSLSKLQLNSSQLNPEVLSRLQQQFNSFNTNTAKSEIQKFIDTTSQLQKTDNNIVKVQNSINKFKNSLDGLKGKYGNLVGNSDSINQLTTFENKIKELESLLTRLKSGNFVNSNSINSTINSANSSFKELTNSVKTSSSALKLAQQDSISFGQAIQNTLSKFGVYTSLAIACRKLGQEIKQATQYIVEMDTAMTNIQMITGKSKESVSSTMEEYKNLANELHTTNSEMASGAEELLRAGYSSDTVKNVMESSIIGAKISGQTTEEVSQQLIAMKNAFNMTDDQVSHTVDVISKLDNTASTSFAEVAKAIQYTAYSAQQAGTPFDRLASYITVVSEKTRMAPETIGQAFKTIYARYSNIKLGNLDEDGKSINDVEKALARVGIKIRDSKDQFRNFDEVLSEFMEKYKSGSMSQVDYLGGIQSLAGTRQRETLMALTENSELLAKHQQDVANAIGSAKKMFDEAYSDSLNAKINDLKNNIQNMYDNFLKSDTLKIGLNLLNSFIEKFGNIPTVIGLATSALIAFKGEAILSFAVLQYGEISTFFSMLIADIASATAGMTGLTAVTTGAKVAFSSLTTIMSVNPFILVATAIAGMVVALNNMESSLDKISNGIDVMKKSTEELSNISDGENIVKQYEDLENKINSGKLSTEEMTQSKKELKSIQEQLAQQFPSLINGFNSEGNAVVTNLDKIKEKIEETKKTSLQDLKSGYNTALSGIESQYVDDTWGSKIIKSINANVLTKIGLSKLNDDTLYGLNTEQAYEYYNTLQKTETLTEKQQKNYSNIKTKLQDFNSQIESIYSTTKNLDDLEGMKYFDFKEGKLVDAKKYFENLSNGIDENTNSVDNNAEAQKKLEESTKALKTEIDNLAESFGKLSSEIDIIDKVIDEMQKYGGVTASTYESLLKDHPEVIKALMAEGDTIQNLTALREKDLKKQEEARNEATNKILNTNFDENGEPISSKTSNEISNGNNREIKKIQITTEEVRKAEESKRIEYEKTKNTQLKAISETSSAYENYQILKQNNNSSVMDNSSELDKINQTTDMVKLSEEEKRKEHDETKDNQSSNISQVTDMYQVYNGLKENSDIDLNNNIRTNSSDTITILGNNYINDAQNFENAEASKRQSLLNTQKFAQGLADTVVENGGIGNALGVAMSKLDESLSQEDDNNTQNKLDNLLSQYKTNMPNIINSSDAKKIDEEQKKTSKDYTVENLEDQTDAYYDLNNAITDVQSNIKLLESRYENLYGTAKTNAIRERISLLQQEKDLHSQMVDKINSELAQQRANLSAKGVSFASNGEISNYNQILTSLTNQANAINTVDENTKKAKEDAIKAVKDIKKQMDEYTSTITKDLASQKESWQDLENQIQDTYKTMLQEVQTGESKVSDVIKNEIDKRKKKELDAIDEVKKALQKQWDTDDYEDQLKEAQDKVLEYEDKIKNAISKRDSNSLRDLRKERQDAINEVNNLVKSHERDMINSELDDQTDAINKKYDEMEKSQNLTKMVTQALQTGFFEINGEIITLSTSMDSFIKDTTVGLTSINLASRELNENLANAISMLQQFNGYSGVNNLLPDVPYQLLLNSNGFVDSKTVFYDKGSRNSSPTINLGGITVNGNLDNVTLEDMNNTITKRLKDVIGNYIS